MGRIRLINFFILTFLPYFSPRVDSEVLECVGEPQVTFDFQNELRLIKWERGINFILNNLRKNRQPGMYINTMVLYFGAMIEDVHIYIIYHQGKIS